MEKRHRNILRKMQSKIVDDVDILQIIDTLISERVVWDMLWDEIQKEPNTGAQIRKLLTLLPTRGPNAYSIFKESMRKNYDWISEQMDVLERTEDSVDSLDAPHSPNSAQSLLPANPPLSVKRTEKTIKLRNELRELKPGCYLVLHALQGYGKSTLASATLRDKDLLEELFQNEIYWIKFAQRQTLAENILIQLNLLFHQVKNLDLLAEPTSEESLKYSLKKHFSQHTHALLVLDDVNSKEIIDAFDFGCKTLVLTTDMDVLKGRKNVVIKMSEGFSLNESLTLFSDATGIPVMDLPHQAREIHNECKGMPLMISMFSAQFEDIKEKLAKKENTEDWSYYLNALREKKSNVILQESLEQLTMTLKLCIEKLIKDDKKYFKTLAIFPEDVNITTQTLSIYWGVPPAEVDARMSRFCKKSLACREWHDSFKSYIYGIHNLVLEHLRENTSPEVLRDLHRLYVNKNLIICDGDFSKLPTDNYVHSYIGYHMEKGKMNEKFCDVYLDFSFIEAKIFHVGPGDLLIDLKKYRDHVTRQDPELQNQVDDLERFLVQQASTLAEYRRRNCLDLVQVALKHPFPGFVRDKAELLANERESRLYLYHSKHSEEYLSSSSQEVPLEIRSIAFTNEAEVILVGSDNGKIIMWSCSSRNYVAFHGNSEDHPITKIVAPVGAKFFVSLSEDGTAKLFEFHGDFKAQRDSYVKTLHPRAKQRAWRNMSDSQSYQDDSKVTFSVEGQKILDLAVSTDGKKIAACTNGGSIAVWDSNGRTLITGSSSYVGTTHLTSLTFTMCNTRLYTVNESVGSVIVLDASTGGYITQFSFHPETDQIISLLSVPPYSNLIIVLLATKLIHVQQRHEEDRFSLPEKKEFARLGDKGLTYTCAVLTTDGKFVVTADTSGSVNVFDIHEGFGLVKSFKSSVSSLDTQWLTDEKRHVICGGKKDTLVPMVHRWKFDPEEKPVVRRLPLFDAMIEPCAERTVIAVATSNRTVQILQNDEEIAETSGGSGKIIHLVISKDGNQVVYVTDEGSVSIFHIKRHVSEKIFQLPEPVGFLEILNLGAENVIVCGIGRQDLQIWKGPMSTQLVEYTGAIIFCDLLKSVDLILTVAETEVKLWAPTTWSLHTKKLTSQTIGKVTSCALSEEQNYLALANAVGKNVTLLKLKRQEKTLPSIIFEEQWAEKFDDEVTICSFSNDEKLLAVGFESGKITIISVQTGTEIHKFNYHRRPVKQLYWSPSSLEELILVSLANELAWWSVSPEVEKPEESSAQRQLSQSLSELTQSQPGVTKPSYIRTSKSLELTSSEIMRTSATLQDDVFETESGSSSSITEDLLNMNGESRRLTPWAKKRPKYSMIPGLLGVVKIDGDVASKVCVSKDFKNFVTIDGDGSIYNLTIFEERNEANLNGGA